MKQSISILKKNDYIFFYPNNSACYYLSGRKNPSKIDWYYKLEYNKPMLIEAIHDLEKNKPKIIFIDRPIKDIQLSIFLDQYYFEKDSVDNVIVYLPQTDKD